MKLYKCVIIGDSDVGKTSMILSYKRNGFPKGIVSSSFNNFIADIVVGGELINLDLWDVPSQEDFDRLRPMFFLQVNLFLICFSIVDPRSFDNVLSKWFPEVSQNCPKVPIILVGTKWDLKSDDEIVARLEKRNLSPITYEQGLDMAKKIGALKYMECSAETQIGFKLFDEAIEIVLRKNKRHKCEIL